MEYLYIMTGLYVTDALAQWVGGIALANVAPKCT